MPTRANFYDEGFTAGEVMVQDRAEITKEIAAAESEFRAALAGRAPGLEWRSAVTPASLASYIAEQARAETCSLPGRIWAARCWIIAGMLCWVIW